MDLLCGHDNTAVRRRGYRIECTKCGSFLDGDFCVDGFDYDNTYGQSRGHFTETVGRLKASSLGSWLNNVGLDPKGLNVCEVGFGGGHTLKLLKEKGARVQGLEVSAANIEHAQSLGISRESLYLISDSRPVLGSKVDLWLFLDSFEHIEDPAVFIEWLKENSAPDACLLLVSPEAQSVSERLLGRLWPHKLKDHLFHWSRSGLIEFFGEHDFKKSASFFPLKKVSFRMLAAHIAHKCGIPCPAFLGFLDSIVVPFNVGEMGLLFQRVEPK